MPGTAQAPELHPRPRAASPRIASIDHYRGYAIFGMIWVNYLGQFDSMPWQFKHHRFGMSYADTIAPLFIFVVGMGFRLSYQRRVEKDGYWPATWRAFKRYLVLIGVGIVLYGPMNWQWWWDALVDIGFGGVLALPFMLRSQAVRAGAAIAYLIVYQVVFMASGYGEWTMKNSIDGGPLGVISWAPILLFGTIAYDLIATRDNKKILYGCIGWGVALCVLGWIFKLPWGELKTEWPFTQRGMTAPYPLYSTGLCFLMYLPFYWICDIKNWRIPMLTVLGMNPLVIYIVQYAVLELYDTFIVPEDSGPALALAGFTAFYLACYAVAWRLYKDNVVIKL